MIEKMFKMIVAVSVRDHCRLVERLGALGVMHISPANPAAAAPPESLLEEIKKAELAISVIRRFRSGGQPPDLAPQELVQQLICCVDELKLLNTTISKLELRLKKQFFWGDLDRKALLPLGDDVRVRFCVLPKDLIPTISADLVRPLRRLKRSRWLVAAASIEREIELPPGAEELSVPAQNNHEIRVELEVLERRRHELEQQLAASAGAITSLKDYVRQLRGQSEFAVALQSGYVSGDVAAVQGWVPQSRVQSVQHELRQGIVLAARVSEPQPDEAPPTLIRYGRFTRALEGLFALLGAYPGYRESDLSAFFILALPIFAAIIIGDAGYALIVLLAALGFARVLREKMGEANFRLVLIIATSALVYGILIGSYIGFSPRELITLRDYLNSSATLPRFLAAPMAAAVQLVISSAVFWYSDGEASRLFLTKMSLLLGIIHLIGARLAKAGHLLPDQRAYAEIGWAIFLSGIFGLVWLLMVGKDEALFSVRTISTLLAVGMGVVALFARPHANPLVRFFGGLGTSVFSSISTFSDLLSYIRLMAIGMAAFYIGVVANQLAVETAKSLGWVLGLMVGVLGHAINMALGSIAIFAHALRLNMLEFSINAGIQWLGYPYRPYSHLSNRGD